MAECGMKWFNYKDFACLYETLSHLKDWFLQCVPLIGFKKNSCKFTYLPADISRPHAGSCKRFPTIPLNRLQFSPR
jgi:hypothetical protein